MALFSFNRTYSLFIQRPPFLIPKTLYNTTPLEDDSATITDQGDYISIDLNQAFEITDLHIEADIKGDEKTQGSDPVKATIKIFNLSSETRSKVTAVNSPVILSAGYGGNNKMVFSGQIYKSTTIKEGQDLVTYLYCKDGYTPLEGVRFSRSYPRNTQYSNIFLDIADQFKKNGINTGTLILNESSNGITSPDSTISEQSWSFSGYLTQALDALCKEFYYKWQIIHSKLYIYPNNYSEMFGTTVVNKDNIISIRPYQDGTKSSSLDSSGTGIELILFLEGDISSSKNIQIEATEDDPINIRNFVGTYRVSDYRHILEYEGNSWYTIVRCDKPKEATV